MPGKSGHGKGKRPSPSKKSKAKQRQAVATTQQQVLTQATEPAVRTNLTTTPTRPQAKATPAAVSAAHHQYVTSELLTIGMLAGVIVVILLVLSIFLS